MNIDDIEFKPINESKIMKRGRKRKYSELIDYALSRVDDGNIYSLEDIIKCFIPEWIEGVEEDSPIRIGLYAVLGKRLKGYLNNYIHLGVSRCLDYKCGYGAIFRSGPIKEKNVTEEYFEQNKGREVPGAIGKVTKKQLENLDFE
jgi:hypothetical protein